MFGNRLGWGISAVMWVVVIGLLWWLHHAATNLGAVGTIGKNAKYYKMELPVQPRELATWMTEPRSSTEIYKKMLAEYEQNADVYDHYVKSGKLDPDLPKVQKAIDLLIEAANCKDGGVFVDNPERLINYENEKSALRGNIKTLGQVALKVARQHEVKKEPDKEKAKAIYKAMWSLGVKLYEERLVFAEWYEARQLLTIGKYLGPMMGEEYNKRFEAFEEQILPFYKKYIEAVQRYMFVLDPDGTRYPQFITWAGDMAAMAERGGDRMWRVEGALALGRAKYVGATPGDRAGALKTLESLANDKDKYVALAAKLGRDLPVEQYRKLR